MTAKISAKRRTAYSRRKKKMALDCYLLLAIPIIGVLVFTLYPIIWVFRWSFYNYNGVPSYTSFVGWENFKTIFTVDMTYFKTWITTLEFVIMKVPFEIFIAMLLSVILYKGLKGSVFFRTMYFLPHLIGTAIVGLIFSNMFGTFGIINGVLLKHGIISEAVQWFGHKGTAMVILVLASTWQSIGINILYILSALTNVPGEVYEAARIDGANGIREFFSITLPLIAPVFQRILLLALVGTLATGELMIVLTNGAPANSTLTVMAYLTKTFLPGFAESATPEIGYGCAMSAVTTILFAVIGVTFNKVTSRISDAF